MRHGSNSDSRTPLPRTAGLGERSRQICGAGVREKTGKHKRRRNTPRLFADERRSEAVLDCLGQTDVGRKAPSGGVDWGGTGGSSREDGGVQEQEMVRLLLVV